MTCVTCNRKQHFNCASLRDEEERNLFLSGMEDFKCSNCIQGVSQCFKPTNESLALDPTNNREGIELVPTVTGGGRDELNPSEESLTDDICLIPDDRMPSKSKKEKNKGISFSVPEVSTQIAPEENVKDKEQVIPSENGNRLLIRRLQDQICKLNEEHAKKEQQLSSEIDSWKEAYRRSVAECEKEKDTRETLEKCLAALDPQRKDNSHQENMRSTRTNAPPSPLGATAKSTDSKKAPCRFYNKRRGCRNGDHCIFEHIVMPPCSVANCKKRDCKLDHKRNTKRTTARGEHIEQTRPTKICSFFNSREGCRNGDDCSFAHILKQLCPNIDVCTDRDCDYNHNGQHFLDQPAQKKPPDISNNPTGVQVGQQPINGFFMGQQNHQRTHLSQLLQQPQQPKQNIIQPTKLLRNNTMNQNHPINTTQQQQQQVPQVQQQSQQMLQQQPMQQVPQRHQMQQQLQQRQVPQLHQQPQQLMPQQQPPQQVPQLQHQQPPQQLQQQLQPQLHQQPQQQMPQQQLRQQVSQQQQMSQEQQHQQVPQHQHHQAQPQQMLRYQQPQMNNLMLQQQPTWPQQSSFSMQQQQNNFPRYHQLSYQQNSMQYPAPIEQHCNIRSYQNMGVFPIQSTQLNTPNQQQPSYQKDHSTKIQPSIQQHPQQMELMYLPKKSLIHAQLDQANQYHLTPVNYPALPHKNHNVYSQMLAREV